jgi:mannose-6-phosphate isomerase-like protein (cupin superfamily)
MQNKPISLFGSSRFSASIAVAVLALTPVAGFAQSKPLPPVVGITAADIQAVLKHKGAEGAGVDRQIKVADLGDYQLGVGVLYRGPTKPGAPVAAITHSKVTEAFYIISGSGTIVTGTTIENDRAFPAETEFVRLAVGPSSGGVFKGGERRPIAAGDVVIVPAGMPHGFDDITDHLTYLSIRPDLAGVLPANYVHPALRK